MNDKVGILKINQKKLNLSGFLDIEKSYQEGIYSDTPANRKLGRVGMSYKQYSDKLSGKDEGKDEKENSIDNQLKKLDWKSNSNYSYIKTNSGKLIKNSNGEYYIPGGRGEYNKYLTKNQVLDFISGKKINTYTKPEKFKNQLNSIKKGESISLNEYKIFDKNNKISNIIGKNENGILSIEIIPKNKNNKNILINVNDLEKDINKKLEKYYPKGNKRYTESLYEKIRDKISDAGIEFTKKKKISYRNNNINNEEEEKQIEHREEMRKFHDFYNNGGHGRNGED